MEVCTHAHWNGKWPVCIHFAFCPGVAVLSTTGLCGCAHFHPPLLFVVCLFVSSKPQISQSPPSPCCPSACLPQPVSCPGLRPPLVRLLIFVCFVFLVVGRTARGFALLFFLFFFFFFFFFWGFLVCLRYEVGLTNARNLINRSRHSRPTQTCLQA